MAPKPPNVRSAPAQPWRCSGVVPVVGPRYGPQTPKRSQRAGAAVALLWSGSRRGAPIWPPTAMSLWPEGEAGQVGVAGAAGGEVAAHQRHAGDALAAEDRARVERLGQARVGARRAHAAERDVGRERPRLPREVEGGQRLVHTCGQRGRRLAARLHAGPQHAGARAGGERAEAVEVEIEGRLTRRGGGQRGLDGGQPRGLDAAQELEREVEIAGGDPGDVGGQRPQAVHGLRQPRAYVVVQQDGDERAREGSYRGDSSRRSSPWMCSRRAGSGSIVSAGRRSASAPSWSPPSSRDSARVASARASMAGADTEDGGGEAAGEAGGVAASLAGGGSGRAAVPMPGFGAGATVPAVVGWPTTGVAAATAGCASRPALRRIADFAHGSVSTSIACSQSFMAVSLCPISERAVPRLN